MPKLSMYMCFFANFVIANATQQKRSASLKQFTELNDFLCKDYIFKLKAYSPIQCGLFCQINKLCDSVFFDTRNNTCIGCEPDSDQGQISTVGEHTLSYEIQRVYPSSATSLVTKTSTMRRTPFSTTADSMTTANSLKTTDFPTSASNALSTTYDFSTSIGYTTIPHSKTYTATLNGQPMMKMTPIPDPSEELKDFKWTAWGNSEYRVIYNVNFDNAQVMCEERKELQDGHLAWIESEAENQYVSDLVNDVKSKLSIDQDAFLGVKVDAKNILSLVPSGQLQAEVYKRSTKHPNYGEENCVAIQSTGDWVATSCFQIMTAICEVDL